MLARSSDSVGDWMSVGADAMACCDSPPAMIALAILTAYNAGAVRKTCAGRIRDLESKLEQTRMLNHAKSLIARQLGVSEHEALQRLRKEARNQRRPMADLARIVIEANRIIAGGVGAPLNGASKVRISASHANGRATGHIVEEAVDEPAV
jgi:hypothetical protein